MTRADTRKVVMRPTRTWILAGVCIASIPLWVASCSSDSDTGGPSNGPVGASGQTSTGGALANATGGQPQSTMGGTSATTGGSGGGPAPTGGQSTGGKASSTGGMAATGGAPTTGGVSPGGAGTGGAAGGAPGGGAAGKSGGSGGGGGGESPAAGPCPTSSIKAGDQTLMLTVDGNARSFLVHAPPAYDGQKRLPVVFDFHGLSGNSNQQKQLSGWAGHGDSEGFITVFPQGLGSTPGWNAGGCCNTIADDVAFVRAIIEELAGKACVDSKRIYSTGCSNGGAMSYILACQASDVIAAVAPVDFDCVVGNGCSQCEPTRPITEIQFRGTDDQAVPYSGAEPNFENWGEINACTGDAAPLSSNSSCQAYPMCGSGEETILCTVQDGSHCGSYRSFMIPQVAWEVLQRHALP
jgi:polyhydroxybutyrate depolymerase